MVNNQLMSIGCQLGKITEMNIPRRDILLHQTKQREVLEHDTFQQYVFKTSTSLLEKIHPSVYKQTKPRSSF